MFQSTMKRCALLTAGLVFLLAHHVIADEDPYAPTEFVVPDGYMVIGGDIVIPVEAAYDGTYTQSFWPDGIVPYSFNGNVDATNQQRVVEAMAEWEAVADLTFIDISVPSPLDGSIVFNNSTVNNSEVGYQGTPQIINIVDWGNKFTIVHEIGHALGFWHEQSRTDRNTYVTIHSDRVRDGSIHNFYTESSSGAYGPYDFDSVMHYKQCAFSICNSDGGIGCYGNEDTCRTISVNEPYTAEWQDKIGQDDHLSTLDGFTMSMLYPWDNWRFVDGTYVYPYPIGSSIGTYVIPWETITKGITGVPTGGTLIVQPDIYAEGDMLINRSMLIRAPLGGVTIR